MLLEIRSSRAFLRGPSSRSYRRKAKDMAKATFGQISDEKQQRVLKEAAKLFAERGFSATDVAELAKRAGVSKGSLYNYFDNKEDLYLHVCKDGLDRSRRAVYGGMDQEWDIYRQVEHMFRQGVRFALKSPHYVRLYLTASAPGKEQFEREALTGCGKTYGRPSKKAHSSRSGPGNCAQRSGSQAGRFFHQQFIHNRGGVYCFEAFSEPSEGILRNQRIAAGPSSGREFEPHHKGDSSVSETLKISPVICCLLRVLQ